MCYGFSVKRQYDSSRRKKAAEKTREDILQAAIRLHWQGITGFTPLAREAGCSLATLRKHFPSKELLYQNCTRAFAETLEMPDLHELGEIDDPAQRTQQCISELCRIHESMFGYAWLGARQRESSPTLDAEMKGYEGLADAIAVIILPLDSPRYGLVRGLLDFLSYRALRLSAKLSAVESRQELTTAVQLLIRNMGK